MAYPRPAALCEDSHRRERPSARDAWTGFLVLADQDLPWEMQLTVNADRLPGAAPAVALLQAFAAASLSR